MRRLAGFNFPACIICANTTNSSVHSVIQDYDKAIELSPEKGPPITTGATSDHIGKNYDLGDSMFVFSLHTHIPQVPNRLSKSRQGLQGKRRYRESRCLFRRGSASAQAVP